MQAHQLAHVPFDRAELFLEGCRSLRIGLGGGSRGRVDPGRRIR